VLAAYEQLLHEGYLEGRTGSGTFVRATLPDESLRPISTSQPRIAPRGKLPKLTPGHDPLLGPFRMHLPGIDKFPTSTWAKLAARNARSFPRALMGYGDPAGLPELRAAIAEHLRTSRAVRCDADDVLVVSGSQTALRLCSIVLASRGGSIALEEPCYPGARGALGAAGTALLSIPVDDEGLSVAALEKARSKVRAVYITPSHQYPLGTSMTATRRLALLDWAERKNAWIIEDDYDSEYRYVSRPLGALQGMRPNARVVYVGGFSKVLFPAVRVGFVVVPPTLAADFVRERDALDVFPPPLNQLVLADFINEGHLARHIRRMRIIYTDRRDALLDGLAEHCGEFLSVPRADAGLHVAAFLSPGFDDNTVVTEMARRGLSALPLSGCYARAPKQGLLLGFGAWSGRRIKLATRALGEILAELA
jgi:GntR family transcriptional regulator/MocR family aminotransferase